MIVLDIIGAIVVALLLIAGILAVASRLDNSKEDKL